MNKNSSIVKILLYQLIKSGVHLGDNSNQLNGFMKNYLLGSRSKYLVFNPYQIRFQLKLLSYLIIDLVSNRQKILIDSNYWVYPSINYFKGLKSVIVTGSKWIGGSLTNFKNIRRSKSLLNSNYYGWDSMCFMPSLLIVFQFDKKNWSLNEAFNLDIPTFVLGDLKINSEIAQKADYLSGLNIRSPESFSFIMNFIRLSIIQGHRKEHLDVLNLI